MTAASNYLENALLNHVLNAVTYTPPTSMYVALYSAAPGDGDTGTEITGAAYARVQIYKQSVTNTPKWDSATGGLVDNGNTISFPTATANYPATVKAVGIRDHATTGNLLFHGALTATQTVNSGSTFKFAAGALDISCD